MSTCNAPPQAPYQPSWPARMPAQKTAREECILGRPCRATECNENEAPSSPDCGPSVSPSGGKKTNQFWGRTISSRVSGDGDVRCSYWPSWRWRSSKWMSSACSRQEFWCSSAWLGSIHSLPDSPGANTDHTFSVWHTQTHTYPRLVLVISLDHSISKFAYIVTQTHLNQEMKSITRPFSTRLVIMTITPTFCSHIILQKSSRLPFSGPWAAIYAFGWL